MTAPIPLSEPVFKVLSARLWNDSTDGDTVLPMPVDVADGFMHFSTRGQLPETLRLHFAGQHDLVLLALDQGALGTGLTWEPSRGGELFPHLHAPCPISAVLWHAPLDTAPDGGFVMPPRF